MKKDITELFVHVDDFCHLYEQGAQQRLLEDGAKKRRKTRVPGLFMSEIMTIILLFHQSPAKNFKYFYQSYLQQYRAEFPKLPSYQRFVELIPRTYIYFCCFFNLLCAEASKKGLYYTDATALPVCHNKRTSRHKVFKDMAALGKTTMGWFFGFKLHLIITEKGELVAAGLTPGNVDDRAPVRDLSQKLQGLMFADKGYIGQELFEDLLQKGLKLVTGLKKNMKNKLMILNEKMLLRKRSIIETVNGLLKENFQISHTRHRSSANALVHIVSTLVAYCFKTNKPRINPSHLIPN